MLLIKKSITFCLQQTLGCSKLSKTPKKTDTSRNSNSLLSQSYRVHFSHRDVKQTFSFFSWNSRLQKRCFWPIYRKSGCPISTKMLIPRTSFDIQPLMSQKLHPWFPLTRSQSKVWQFYRSYPKKNQWVCSSQENPSHLKSPKTDFQNQSIYTNSFSETTAVLISSIKVSI